MICNAGIMRFLINLCEAEKPSRRDLMARREAQCNRLRSRVLDKVNADAASLESLGENHAAGISACNPHKILRIARTY
jgi:hypothetical protein